MKEYTPTKVFHKQIGAYIYISTSLWRLMTSRHNALVRLLGPFKHKPNFGGIPGDGCDCIEAVLNDAWKDRKRTRDMRREL